ncbi:MAG: hypothetical protein HY869_02400 [Chloroflexi bacterium]|nr:hypothetical protein [Chloroflexota bacterium]
MKTRLLIIPKYVRIITFLLGLVLAFAWIGTRPCPTGPTIIKDHYYLDKVWPAPSMKVPVGCFLRRSLSQIDEVIKFVTSQGNRKDITPSISVHIRPLTIVHELGDQKEFSKRLILYVDGNKGKNPDMMIENNSLLVAYSLEELEKMPRVPGWYHFGWFPFLLPGEHHARFVIVKRDGTTLEYEWDFTITWW